MIISVLGYVLLALLGLLLLLVLLVLFVPAGMEAGGNLRFEPAVETTGTGEDFWLELLAGDEQAGERPPFAGATVLEGSLDGRLAWMGGAVVADTQGVTLFGRRLGARRMSPRKAARRKRSGRKPRRGRGFRPQVDLATVRGLLPGAWKAVLRTWAALALRLRLVVSFGAGDPVSTALMAGPVSAVVYPFAHAANARRSGSFDLRLRPVFDREVLTVSFDLSGRTSLYAVLRPLVGFALRREVRKLWWPVRRRRRVNSVKEAA